ncbi:MAG: histidine kinase dimerization/phospho-acceptor domain-containing protein, partial [Bacteroidales bacterium]
AEQSDKLISAFLANMSHELRTPLNAIVGFSELMSETDDPEEKAQYYKIIANNNEVLLRLIGDILDLSKIEAGMIDLKREVFDMARYFNELSESFRSRITNPDVELVVENPYRSCEVFYDKGRFTQVVNNFVSNAINIQRKGISRSAMW